MNDIKKKIELLREQEINEIKNKPKSKLNMLDNDKNYTLKNLDVDLTTLITKCNLFERPYDIESFEKERELQILAEKKD